MAKKWEELGVQPAEVNVRFIFLDCVYFGKITIPKGVEEQIQNHKDIIINDNPEKKIIYDDITVDEYVL